LSNNNEAYNAYFAWKKHVVFSDKKMAISPICDMCIRLHLEDYYNLNDEKKLENNRELVNHVCHIVMPDSKKFFNLNQFNILNNFIDYVKYTFFGLYN
jgi:hypothetical protein